MCCGPVADQERLDIPLSRSTLFVGTSREEMEINPPFRRSALAIGEDRAVVDGLNAKCGRLLAWKGLTRFGTEDKDLLH